MINGKVYKDQKPNISVNGVNKSVIGGGNFSTLDPIELSNHNKKTTTHVFN